MYNSYLRCSQTFKRGVLQHSKSQCNHLSTADITHKFLEKGSAFSDHVYVKAEAGKGGDGCVSFLREKYLPKGPPNGGSGGHGGDVYIMAVEGETSLSTPPRVRSLHGQNGRGSSMNGKKGEDMIIKVPVGTVVRQLEMPERMLPREDQNDRGVWVHFPRYEEDNLESDRLRDAEKTLRKQQRSLMPSKARGIKEKSAILLDLDAPTSANNPHLLCRGGIGGFGNTFFLTADNRAPRFASRGLAGEQKYFELELKTLADVGLVGLPNAGKSTFLGAISNAKPRVANWAFTTLSPYLGTISYAEGKFTVADIPGIIEGASQNKGLGHGFLRHIERAEILAFVIDLSGDPVNDYKTLRSELKAYSAGLEDRQSVIIANKADLEGTQEALVDLRNIVDQTWSATDGNCATTKPLVVPLSSKDQLGVRQAIEIMKSLVEKKRELKRQQQEVIGDREGEVIPVIQG